MSNWQQRIYSDVHWSKKNYIRYIDVYGNTVSKDQVKQGQGNQCQTPGVRFEE